MLAESFTPHLANGTIDILINIAVNEGYSISYSGKFTLTMRNYFGSLVFLHPGVKSRKELLLLASKLVTLNQSTFILGERPSARQQLCFIDSFSI